MERQFPTPQAEPVKGVPTMKSDSQLQSDVLEELKWQPSANKRRCSKMSDFISNVTWDDTPTSRHEQDKAEIEEVLLRIAGIAQYTCCSSHKSSPHC